LPEKKKTKHFPTNFPAVEVHQTAEYKKCSFILVSWWLNHPSEKYIFHMPRKNWIISQGLGFK